jgi:hypothetical protein
MGLLQSCDAGAIVSDNAADRQPCVHVSVKIGRGRVQAVKHAPNTWRSHLHAIRPAHVDDFDLAGEAGQWQDDRIPVI